MQTITRPDLTVDALEDALDDAPQCECVHRERPRIDEERCPERADYRVSFLCDAGCCDEALVVHLLCEACLESLVAAARFDPAAPRLRVTPL